MSNGAAAKSRDTAMDLIKMHWIESIFAGGGEMGARMRTFDWSAWPLGAVAQSPGASIRVMLGSGYTMLVCWGQTT